MARSPQPVGTESRVQDAAPVPGNLPVTVLMNTGSGSEDKLAARTAIDALLQDAGRDVHVLPVRRPRDLPILARQAADRRPGILAAAGGDGTLNAVATVARERDLPLAVIPLGTFNYFARDLGIPLETDAATRLIVEGAIRRVPVGQVNGRLFLNNASIGLYRRLIEQRETHKGRFGRNRLVALLSGLLTLLREHRSYPLRMTLDGQSLSFSTPSVFFGCNALQMEQLGLDEALCIARGEMAILAPREMSRLERLGLVLRGAFANLETAANLRQFCAREVKVERLDKGSWKVRVAIDGEVADCPLPLLVETVPDALQVVVPWQGRGGR